MTKAKLWALAGLPFLLAGCGGEDSAEDSSEMVVTDTAAAPAAMPMDTGAMAGGAGGMATNVTMQALNNSGVSGEATLTPQGSQLQVMVRLTGLQQGEHPGHIHAGTCDAPGSAVVPLQPITAGGDGSGTMTTTVEVDPNTAMNGQHIIQYHQAGGGPGVVCGAIPQHQM